MEGALALLLAAALLGGGKKRRSKSKGEGPIIRPGGDPPPTKPMNVCPETWDDVISKWVKDPGGEAKRVANEIISITTDAILLSGENDVSVATPNLTTSERQAVLEEHDAIVTGNARPFIPGTGTLAAMRKREPNMTRAEFVGRHMWYRLNAERGLTQGVPCEGDEDAAMLVDIARQTIDAPDDAGPLA